jgi:hypothetical protein
MTERVGNEGQDQKRGNNWGLFHLFVLISAALIIALWGVIIRGGEPPPPKTAYVVERPVVLLFLVDTAVKRYAHYESGRYRSPFFHDYHLPSDTRRQGSGCENGLIECSSEQPDPVAAKPLVPQVALGQLFLVSPPWP